MQLNEDKGKSNEEGKRYIFKKLPLKIYVQACLALFDPLSLTFSLNIEVCVNIVCFIEETKDVLI